MFLVPASLWNRVHSLLSTIWNISCVWSFLSAQMLLRTIFWFYHIYSTRDEVYLVKFQYWLFNKYRFHWAAVQAAWQLCRIQDGMFTQSSHLTESVNWGNLCQITRIFILAYVATTFFILPKYIQSGMYDGSWVILFKEIITITVLIEC